MLLTAIAKEYFRALQSYGGTAKFLMKRYKGVIREDEAWHYTNGFFDGLMKAEVANKSDAYFWLFGVDMEEWEDDARNLKS